MARTSEICHWHWESSGQRFSWSNEKKEGERALMGQSKAADSPGSNRIKDEAAFLSHLIGELLHQRCADGKQQR
jgi:hypothetical protein